MFSSKKLQLQNNWNKYKEKFVQTPRKPIFDERRHKIGYLLEQKWIQYQRKVCSFIYIIYCINNF